jgi:hypothetical protein
MILDTSLNVDPSGRPDLSNKCFKNAIEIEHSWLSSSRMIVMKAIYPTAEIISKMISY